MTTNAITALEKELVNILRDEYSFYQSLYVLLDKHRDLVKYDKDEQLLDLYAESERCQRRIRESEARIETLKERHPQAFRIAAVLPEVKKLATNISVLIQKNLDLVQENEQYVRDRQRKLAVELENLKQSDKIVRYLSDGEPASTSLLDGHQKG